MQEEDAPLTTAGRHVHGLSWRAVTSSTSVDCGTDESCLS